MSGITPQHLKNLPGNCKEILKDIYNGIFATYKCSEKLKWSKKTLIKQTKFSVEMVKRKINLSNLDHINRVSAMVTKLNR